MDGKKPRRLRYKVDYFDGFSFRNESLDNSELICFSLAENHKLRDDARLHTLLKIDIRLNVMFFYREKIEFNLFKLGG